MQLKMALTVDVDPYNRVDNLLLSIRNIQKQNLSWTPADIVFETSLKLPGQYFEADQKSNPSRDFVKKMKRQNELIIFHTN